MKELNQFDAFLLNLADAERRLLEEFARLHSNEISHFEKYLIWRKKKRFIKVLRWIQQKSEERKQQSMSHSSDAEKP